MKGKTSKSLSTKRKFNITDVQQELMADMSKMMKQRLEKRSEKDRSTDEIFGSMVGSELAQLPEVLKIQAKNEINNSFVKCQMQNQSYNSTMSSFIPYVPPSHPSFSTLAVGHPHPNTSL